MVPVNHVLSLLVFSKLFAGFLVYHLWKRLLSGMTAMQTLQPLQQCWQHSYIYFPKTTSGYDAEHVHSTSLVNHGEACSEWNLSC
ncbi:unnamed protein product [Staurois parvus]|uniref:Secreted protein n=1 Tax=Staurois parvus TaxID=386267 RepID=A0ABN9CB77_9NEOB|nr:unnamed protein product [Staurois parvus]